MELLDRNGRILAGITLESVGTKSLLRGLRDCTTAPDSLKDLAGLLDDVYERAMESLEGMGALSEPGLGTVVNEVNDA